MFVKGGTHLVLLGHILHKVVGLGRIHASPPPFSVSQVKFRLTHPKKSAVARRIIIALGVIGEEAPATLDAGSDPVGQANTARTPLAALGARHGPSVCVWIE